MRKGPWAWDAVLAIWVREMDVSELMEKRSAAREGWDSEEAEDCTRVRRARGFHPFACHIERRKFECRNAVDVYRSERDAYSESAEYDAEGGWYIGAALAYRDVASESLSEMSVHGSLSVTVSIDSF